MGKSKRAMNPADALRKQQRKRELKKNKEDRKKARASILAKKDVGKIKQDIARLEHLASLSQLDKLGQTRLESLKVEAMKIEKAKQATELTGAQAAFVARMHEQEKKQEGEARKLVFDPKKGAFVPVKKKSTKPASSSEQQQESSSDSETDSDSESDSSTDTDTDSDMENLENKDEEKEEENEVPKVKPELTESDDDYEIPLPPGPPPPRPFNEQLMPLQAIHMMQPPPPPPGVPPFRSHFNPGMIPPPPPPPHPPAFYHNMPPFMRPPPPPPPPFGYSPPVMSPHYLPRPPPRPPAHFRPYQHRTHPPPPPIESSSSLSNEPAKPIAALVPPTISAEPQLRDLRKELIGFVPAAVRRKQAAAKKASSLPKVARPAINAAPAIEQEEE